MSTKTIAYEQKLPEITAIDRDDVKTPSMPMDVFLQEANNLYHWAKADLAELQKAGLSADLFIGNSFSWKRWDLPAFAMENVGR